MLTEEIVELGNSGKIVQVWGSPCSNVLDCYGCPRNGVFSDRCHKAYKDKVDIMGSDAGQGELLFRRNDSIHNCQHPLRKVGEERMPRYTQPTRQDVLRSIVYLLIYVTVISVSAFFLLIEYWYVWAVIVLAGMALLVNWHKSKTVYSCPNCEHVFEISFLTDLAAPHGLDRDGAWLLLRCPSCRQRHKTRVLKRDG